MSCCSKEKMDRNDNNNTFKSQSAKSDREMYRICPSKLSKRELEDLYFTLLENNLELKKTINGQDDKIRVLSTQVQRLNNSNDRRMSKDMKECCTTKAFVNEQKDFISELKETNKRMAERIEQLNMKLSSAKQFSRTTPPQMLNSRGLRPSTASPPKKHNCLTKDQDNEQVLKLSISTQWEDKTPRRSTTTQTPLPLQRRPSKADQPCDENKCRSLMEELKIKIVSLQEELFNVHDEYSTRIGRLETEVSEVRKENIQVRYERTASAHELKNTVKRTSDVLAQYRLTEAKCSELGTQLAIEKRKVAELETQLKAANMTDQFNKTIEDHLTSINGTPRECLKCKCGCPPPQLSPRAMNEKAPIKTLPPNCPGPPKERESEDKTKYSPSKHSSSTSQQISKSPPSKTISEISNCDTCGCKVQLASDVVHCPTPDEILNCETCGCKAKPMSLSPKYSPTSAEVVNCPECELLQDLSSQPKDIQCDLCGCSPKNKVKNKDVECCCPSWGKTGILKSPSVQTEDIQCDLCGCSSSKIKDDNSPCIKCCYKDKEGATESPPSKNDKLIPPPGAQTRWSPSKDMNSTKSSKTGDDSSYQDTEEVVLLKQNRELMTRILELQNQVDRMKIKICGMPEAKPGIIYESTGTPKIFRDNATVASAAAPLLGALKKMPELPEAVPARPSYAVNTRTTSTTPRPLLREFEDKLPVEQIEYIKSIEDGNDEFKKQLPISTIGSDERVREPGKILSIEILGNPKEPVRTRNWDDTRAKTMEDVDGTIKISEESGDKLSPFELVNDDYREHYKTNSHKLKIIEKKKLEIPGSSKPESGNISLKSAMSDVSGPGFNPEKLKYLEAEGVITEPQLGDDMSKLKGHSSSLTESIPSNPELGFGIPRLASKLSQDKYKAKAESGQPKKSNGSHRARDDIEVLQDKLKLPITEGLLANNPTAPKQTDETKKKEDCEYCAACSFDKECELIHENANNHRMNKLAAEMQKERTKKHDQHNSLQIPGPIPTSDNYKRQKMGCLCCHDIKPKINGKQTTATTDGPANQPDVPLLDKRQHIGTNSIKIDKKILTHHESIKQENGSPTKEDLIVNPKIYEQNTYSQTYGPASLTDAPLLDKRQHIGTDSIKIDKKILTHDESIKQKKGSPTKEDLIINPKIYEQNTYCQTCGPASLTDAPLLDKRQHIGTDSIKIDKKILTHDESIKQKKGSPTKEDLIINPKIYEQNTYSQTCGPASLTDAPLLDKRPHIGTDSIKIDKKILTHDESTKQKKGSPTKEDLIINPKIYEQNTYSQTCGPASLTDAPLLNKREDSNDENKPSGIVFIKNNALDPPLIEMKMPTYHPHSERMLPTLLAPTNPCGRPTQVERKADVAQSTDQQLAEKSSQVPTNIADSPRHRCVVSLYRRRSGSLRYRTVPVSVEPPVCRCPGQQDGYCTDKPRKKVLTSERGTYTVNSKQTDTSPDNTDLEMSCLSDLPMEKEKKSTFKSRPLSPGEDRTTTFTNTYSYYSPPTNSLLSEGELPTTSKPKHTDPDINRAYLNAAPAYKLETPQAQQMEAALNAISEELRRCRTMMHSQRPAEVTRLPTAIL